MDMKTGVTDDREYSTVRWYMGHRQQREQQVLDALVKGLASVEDITKDIYPRNLKKGLVRTAQGNVRTHLEKLVKEGAVTETASKYELG